jgi:hypothetical protein
LANIDQYLNALEHRTEVTESAFFDVEKKLGIKLPIAYRNFLKLNNGGEGFIGESSYVAFWPVEELAAKNRAYEVEKQAPGLLVFASDGGGEAYGFDTRAANWPVVQVPFIGMEWKVAWPMGESFDAFLQHLYDSE